MKDRGNITEKKRDTQTLHGRKGVLKYVIKNIDEKYIEKVPIRFLNAEISYLSFYSR